MTEQSYNVDGAEGEMIECTNNIHFLEDKPRIVSTSELRRLLHYLKDKRPDICIRYS